MSSRVRSHRPPCYLLLSLFLLAVTAPWARAQESVTVPKDSVRVFAESAFKTVGMKDVYGWKPVLVFSVKGPVASGSRLWVEFTLGAERLKFDCTTMVRQYHGSAEIDEWHAACDDTAPGNHIVFFSGTAPFSIHLANELQGSEAALFSGKVKVGNVPAKTGFEHPLFYVDEDWRLPIAYVFLLQQGDGVTAAAANLRATLWVRGRSGDLEAHLFYQGKDVAQSGCKYTDRGQLSAKAENGVGYTGRVWWGLECDFPAWDHKPAFSADVRHLLGENPGEYEIKALANGRLARSLKFTVAADDTIVDNGVASNNKLGDDRIIVPVKVMGDGDGAWDRTAWKTGAFYGNPLAGFTAEP